MQLPFHSILKKDSLILIHLNIQEENQMPQCIYLILKKCLKLFTDQRSSSLSTWKRKKTQSSKKLVSAKLDLDFESAWR